MGLTPLSCQLCAAPRVGLFQRKIQSTVDKADRSRTVHTLIESCTAIKLMYNILHGASYLKWHTVVVVVDFGPWV